MSEESENMQLTPEEVEALEQALSKNYPLPTDREGLYNFLKKVMSAKREDLSKVANLEDAEVFACYFRRQAASYGRLMGFSSSADWIDSQTDSFLSLSDSKTGFLLDKAITQRKEIATRSMSGKQKKFFGKKGEE